MGNEKSRVWAGQIVEQDVQQGILYWIVDSVNEEKNTAHVVWLHDSNVVNPTLATRDSTALFPTTDDFCKHYNNIVQHSKKWLQSKLDRNEPVSADDELLPGTIAAYGDHRAAYVIHTVYDNGCCLALLWSSKADSLKEFNPDALKKWDPQSGGQLFPIANLNRVTRSLYARFIRDHNKNATATPTTATAGASGGASVSGSGAPKLPPIDSKAVTGAANGIQSKTDTSSGVATSSGTGKTANTGSGSGSGSGTNSHTEHAVVVTDLKVRLATSDRELSNKTKLLTASEVRCSKLESDNSSYSQQLQAANEIKTQLETQLSGLVLANSKLTTQLQAMKEAQGIWAKNQSDLAQLFPLVADVEECYSLALTAADDAARDTSMVPIEFLYRCFELALSTVQGIVRRKHGAISLRLRWISNSDGADAMTVRSDIENAGIKVLNPTGKSLDDKVLQFVRATAKLCFLLAISHPVFELEPRMDLRSAVKCNKNLHQRDGDSDSKSDNILQQIWPALLYGGNPQTPGWVRTGKPVAASKTPETVPVVPNPAATTAASGGVDVKAGGGVPITGHSGNGGGGSSIVGTNTSISISVQPAIAGASGGSTTALPSDPPVLKPIPSTNTTTTGKSTAY